MISYLVIRVEKNQGEEATLNAWLREERKRDVARAQLGAIAGDRDPAAWLRRFSQELPGRNAVICEPGQLVENLYGNNIVITFVNNYPV